jgi:histidinol-phosphate aminotransferase
VVSLFDLPLRDDLKGLTPYGAPQIAARVALNVNENTHAIPEDVAYAIVTALAESVMTANRYPDREFTDLRVALADYLGTGLGPEQIWAANGSNEVLQHALQAFGGAGRTALGFEPSYSMYSILARSTGTTWISGERDEDFRLSADTAVRQVAEHAPDLVFLCAPNNPTGTPLAIDTIAEIYDATSGIVVVDEAYFEFTPAGTASATTLLPGRERLIVSRTMSKAFAFAGARLGYLAADPAVVDALRLVRLPYHLSTFTQAAATAALRHTQELLAVVGDITAQRDRIQTELPDLGYPTVPSAANFVLFGGVRDPAATFEDLRATGILVRDVGIPHHLRVTAGTHAETSEFLSAMSEISPR